MPDVTHLVRRAQPWAKYLMIHLLYDYSIDGHIIPNGHGPSEPGREYLHYCVFLSSHLKKANVPVTINAEPEFAPSYYPIEFWGHWLDGLYQLNWLPIIPESRLEKLRSPTNRVYLLLWGPGEGFEFFHNKHYKYLSEVTGIPPHKIIVVWGDLNIQEQLAHRETITGEKNFIPIRNVVPCAAIEGIYAESWSERWQFNNPTLPVSSITFSAKKANYLFLNARPRPHRLAMLYGLWSRQLLKHGMWSWRNRGPSTNVGVDLELNQIARASTMLGQDHTHDHEFLQFVNSGPYCLGESPDLSWKMSMLPPIQWYRDTMFTIVSETLFGTEHTNPVQALFISEKTWQPVFYGHPFVVLGCPGTLNHLRECGYSTFPMLFDERYDSIQTPTARLHAVLATVEAAIKDTKFIQKLTSKEVLGRLEHNQTLLTSLRFRQNLINTFDQIRNVADGV